MTIRDEVLELLRRDPAFREEVRRQLLTEEVLGLPAVVRELAEAQRRTEEQIRALGVQVERLAEQVERQGVQVERLAEQVGALASWQRGEAGRREGERFEREIVRRAPVLFNGGKGGAPDEPWVRERLAEHLRARLHEEILPEEDPFLADLLWWKGEQLAVVEVSVQVNGTDVARAARRAATLREAGVEALAVVVGSEWAAPDAARQADASKVEWKVGLDRSTGFLAFRRAGPG